MRLPYAFDGGAAASVRYSSSGLEIGGAVASGACVPKLLSHIQAGAADETAALDIPGG